MKISTPEQTLALKKRLGWIDHSGREMGWERYVKPYGYYKDDDEEKPRKKNAKYTKKSGRNSERTDKNPRQ